MVSSAGLIHLLKSTLAGVTTARRPRASSYIEPVTTLVFDHLGLIDYAQAWDEQRRVQAARAR